MKENKTFHDMDRGQKAEMILNILMIIVAVLIAGMLIYSAWMISNAIDAGRNPVSVSNDLSAKEEAELDEHVWQGNIDTTVGDKLLDNTGSITRPDDESEAAWD